MSNATNPNERERITDLDKLADKLNELSFINPDKSQEAYNKQTDEVKRYVQSRHPLLIKFYATRKA